MPVELELKTRSTVPLEVEGVVPAALRGLSLDVISALSIWHGNQQVPLGEFFTIRGSADDEVIQFQGDLSGVHWIGAKMTSGRIHVQGHAGRHLGSEMSGGEIAVEGNAGDWLAGEMRGGQIVVRGNAGHLVGAAYRGSPRGMTGGLVVIGGNAGNEVGRSMRRGAIMVQGAVRDALAFNMLAGTIVVGGECGQRPGAGMRRGSVLLASAKNSPLLPTFRESCRTRPLFLQLLIRDLARRGIGMDAGLLDREYRLFSGDLLCGGKGELFVAA